MREACSRAQLTLDVIGEGVDNVSARPQEVLGQYDIVFAKARCALEALAVGNAVVLCDSVGLGPMVTTGEMDQLQRLNFGIRTLQEVVDPRLLEREIARYDPADAAEVSRRIRASAGRESAIDQIVALYYEVISEYERTGGPDLDAEGRAEAFYLQQLVKYFEENRTYLLNSRTFRLRKLLLNLPLAGPLVRSFRRRYNVASRSEW